MAKIAGLPCYIGIKKETTPGTMDLTSMVFLPVRPGASIEVAYEHTLLDHMGIGGAGVQTAAVTTGIAVEGSFQVFATYVGLGYLLESAFGSEATTGPAGSVYTHTYSMGTPTSFSLSVHMADGTRHNFAGCRVTQLVYEMGPGMSGQNSLGRLSFTVIGMTKGSTTTGNSVPTLPTGINSNVVAHTHVSAITWNTVDMVGTSVETFKLTLNRNLTGLYAIGVNSAAEIVQNGFTTVMVECSGALESGDRTIADAHAAMTSSDAVFTTTSTNVEFTFTVQNAIVTKHADNAGRQGPVKASWTWQGRASTGTNNGCALVLKNTNANHYS